MSDLAPGAHAIWIIGVAGQILAVAALIAVVLVMRLFGAKNRRLRNDQPGDRSLRPLLRRPNPQDYIWTAEPKTNDKH